MRNFFFNNVRRSRRSRNIFLATASLVTPLVFAALIFNSSVTHAVVGGQQLDIKSAPATVALINRRFVGRQGNSLFDGQFCAGTVIAKRWVLTAAHCMFDNFLASGNRIPMQDIAVLMGSTTLKRRAAGSKYVALSGIIVHGSFVSPELGFDIALLRLNTDASVTPAIIDTHPVGSESQAMVVGWGSTSADMSRPVRADHLRYAVQTMVPGERCRSTYSFTNESMLCVGTNRTGIGSCMGDSGGGLYRYTTDVGRRVTTLMGINSFGDIRRCHKDRFGSGYTRVGAYLDWIRNQTGIAFDQTPRQDAPQARGIRVDLLAARVGANASDIWQIQKARTYEEVYQGYAKWVPLPPGEYQILNLSGGYRLDNLVLEKRARGVTILGRQWWQIQHSFTHTIYYQGPAKFVSLPPGNFYKIINLDTGFKFNQFYVR